MFRRRIRSRTTTEPCSTVVFVPEHVSVTRHFVPRTVAELWRPRVRKRPFTDENSVRRRVRAAPADAFGAPPFGTFALHALSPAPTIDSVVRRFLLVCCTWNCPSLNDPR